jgi:hypothetical protein
MLSLFLARAANKAVVFEHNAILKFTGWIQIVMQKMALLFVLLFAMQALAKDASRCGVDAFGNDVCVDKDRVLSNAPAKSAPKRSGNEAGSAPTGLKDGAEEKRDEEKGSKRRCGTDQFGNTVCSQ